MSELPFNSYTLLAITIVITFIILAVIFIADNPIKLTSLFSPPLRLHWQQIYQLRNEPTMKG